MNLWMRWVDFRALRDLLLIVGSYPRGLRANELEKLATDEQVLLRRDGQPYAKSTHYHHRRTLERLGLLEKQNRQYTLNPQNPTIHALTTRTELRRKLLPYEKEAFANAILRNEDCHEVFFGHFLKGYKLAGRVTTFVEQAHPVEIVIRTGVGENMDHSHGNGRIKRVAIRPAGTIHWSFLEGANAEQAIHFGLRSWCVDQLGFLDVTYSPDGTYTTFPKYIIPKLTDRELETKMFIALDFAGDWATIRVPDCTLSTGIKQRVSVDQVKGVLMHWVTAHPDLVAGVPTRLEFITAGLSDSQHALALKSYLHSRSGAYLSHLRIHRTLCEHIQNGVPKS